jgi:hypothetical protein
LLFPPPPAMPLDRKRHPHPLAGRGAVDLLHSPLVCKRRLSDTLWLNVTAVAAAPSLAGGGV